MSTIANKKEMTFAELCKSLDEQHERYLSGKAILYTQDELLEKLLNRKNTFLTK